MTFEFEKWQCGDCGFIWYECPSGNKRSYSNLDHGCPQGCDNSGICLGTMKIIPSHVDCSKLKAPVCV